MCYCVNLSVIKSFCQLAKLSKLEDGKMLNQEFSKSNWKICNLKLMTVVQMLGAHPLIALQLSPQSKQTMGEKQ